MTKHPDMGTYSKVFGKLWAIWKHLGARHSDSEAWEQVISLSDDVRKLVPEDETMQEVARILLRGLERRADELAKEEKA